MEPNTNLTAPYPQDEAEPAKKTAQRSARAPVNPWTLLPDLSPDEHASRDTADTGEQLRRQAEQIEQQRAEADRLTAKCRDADPESCDPAELEVTASGARRAMLKALQAEVRLREQVRDYCQAITTDRNAAWQRLDTERATAIEAARQKLRDAGWSGYVDGTSQDAHRANEHAANLRSFLHRHDDVWPLSRAMLEIRQSRIDRMEAQRENAKAVEQVRQRLRELHQSMVPPATS